MFLFYFFSKYVFIFYRYEPPSKPVEEEIAKPETPE